jgi:hypothetical protein
MLGVDGLVWYNISFAKMAVVWVIPGPGIVRLVLKSDYRFLKSWVGYSGDQIFEDRWSKASWPPG